MLLDASQSLYTDDANGCETLKARLSETENSLKVMYVGMKSFVYNQLEFVRDFPTCYGRH